MSQVEYDELAEYYALCNESSVDYDGQARLLLDAWARFGPSRSRKAPRVVDVACGAGLLTKRLLAQGLRVVSVDLSPGLLCQAARLPGARAAVADMRRLPFSGSFDLAACLLHTMNYMTDDEDLAAAFGALAQSLRPGGLAIVDFIAYEPRQDWNASWTDTVEGEGVKIVCRHQQTADWRAMVATDSHTYTIHDAKGVRSVSGVDRLRITTAGEMSDFASAAGLEPLQVTRRYALDATPGWDGGVLIARRDPAALR